MPIKDLRIDLNPELKKLDVNARRDVLSKTLEGEWATVFKGRGIEFAGFRKYTYGDDASLIDWKASLRAKETLVREFEDYKNFTVFFLLDVSDSMLFTSIEKLKCEYAAELAYMMADAINKAGDAVGLAMFNDKFVNNIQPTIGSETLRHIETNLLNPNNYGGNYDLPKALLMTRSFIDQKAVLIIISDFLGLKKGWDKYIKLMADNYELIGIMIKDPRDRELPSTGGQMLLKDPFTGKNIYVDTKKYAKKYKEMNLIQENEVKEVFKKSRGDFLILTTDEDYISKLTGFFRKRSKRSE
ncbi:DUF58 domain-containing protein [Candidatus Woesearchaeota archaeon]|nr:DUF58 domain-containing protein [Candidatus Woesearchaeota archaeon]MCF7901113.1 DUF58 domain-containing protein [Candidatus Woesearchaeota archaeon]MCF8012898.1 DUF58 domain-containing protein [Candidatus Woesearchaeota archaeon]